MTTPTSRARPLLRQLWSSDYGLHVLLVSLLAAMFVAPALVSAHLLHPIAVDVFFSLVIVSGVMAIAGRLHLVMAAFALCTIATRWVHLGLNTRELAVVDGVFSGVMVAVLAVLILAQVFRAGPMTMHRIEGAVAVYLLLGVLWGNAYRIVWLAEPAAFTTATGPVTDAAALYYFSFVTLTTVGFGDIVPASQAARGLAMMEALTGQLYPAILIARLVSLQIIASEHAGRRRPGGAQDDSDAA